MFPTDSLNFTNNLQNNAQLVRQKQMNDLNEMFGRPTFIPLTTAYNDSGEAPPQVATLTDKEEAELLKIDSFGGEYPNRSYAQHDRARRAYQMAIDQGNNQLFLDRHNALKNLMANTKFRGRPLSTMQRSKTAQDLTNKFNASYRDSEELLAAQRGRQILKDLSDRILDADPADRAFIETERKRIDAILGRRPININNPFGTYTGI
jgi:hypothetical protein